MLKKQRQVRGSYARSDVAQLLNLGQHDRALLRVSIVPSLTLSFSQKISLVCRSTKYK